MSAPVPAEIKAHPSYSDGYLDAFEGAARQANQPPEYDVGFEAGKREVEILSGVGFQRSGEGFSISLGLTGEA